jgi:pimeloyl-ACP methyl ester carboxylesterase
MVTRETIALLNADEPHRAYAAVLDYDPRPDLGRIAQRTLVVCGADEYLAGSVDAAARLLPDGIGVIVPGAGLDLPETHHAELARIIRRHVSTSGD